MISIPLLTKHSASLQVGGVSPSEFWQNWPLLKANIAYLVGSDKLYRMSIIEFDDPEDFTVPNNLEGVVLGISNIEKLTHIAIAYRIKVQSFPKSCFSKCLPSKQDKFIYSYTFSSESTASFLSSSSAMKKYIQSKIEEPIPYPIQHRELLEGETYYKNISSCMKCFSLYKPDEYSIW